MNYNDMPGLRWSRVKPGLDSPRALAYALDNAAPDSAAKGLGRAIHMVALEGREPPALPAVCLTPSGALSTSRESKAALAQLAADGIEAYTPTDIAEAKRLAHELTLHPIAAETLDLCPERERAWQATIGGVLVKAQSDLWGRAGILADLKSTSKRISTERDLQSEIIRWGYHGQLAWYRRVMRACGQDVREMRLLFVQTVAPFDVAVVVLDDDWMAAGEEMVDRVFAHYAIVQAAREAKIPVPGAHPSLVSLPAPRWLVEDDEAGAAAGLEGFGDE